MASPSRLLLLFLVLSLSLAEGIGGSGGQLVGAKKKIKDVGNNKEVQDLGRFAVDYFNRHSRGSSAELLFSRVLEAQSQVVAGIKYYLTIIVSDADSAQTYEAVVLVKWSKKNNKGGKSRKLLYFGLPDHH